jgi:16S rRNA (cytosine967-C5)-methyltransferase
MAERRRADPARLAAYDVVKAVRVDDAYANLALPAALATHGLRGRDAAFATELVSGTIRRQLTYDAIIDACLTRPRLEAKVRDALRLGVHQLLAMRVPDHAAISTTVDVVRARVGQGPAGLVNAVLRRVAGRDLGEWLAEVAPSPDLDAVGHASVVHSHPRWVVQELSAALAATRPEDDVAAVLAADNEAPRVCLVARPGLSTPDELPGERGRWSPHAVHLAGGDPGDVPAVAQGRAGVQDEGSQLVGLLAAAVPVDGSDRLWLDSCAGPGGKAALLAALAGQREARVLAAELQPHRARLVARACAAAGQGLLAVVAVDGRVPAWQPDTFDRALVDAPCSGLGALRRRPESRWRRRPDDLAALTRLQVDLLERALDATRPGGVVTYATCTPVLAETRDVVADVLSRRPEVRQVDLTGVVPGLRDATGPMPGTVQLWPHVHGTDAMFVAALRR